MSHADLVLLGRVAVGIAVAFVFGFERQLRGSPAGDRTFSLVGAASTAVTAVAGLQSPQAVAGIMTGLGFIGAGVLLRRGQLVTGLTTAASIFAVAGIGIVIGYGHVLLGIVLGAILLLILEIQHIPFLRFLDARNYADRFQNDRAFPVSTGVPIGPLDTPGSVGPAGPAEGTAGSDDH
ncbi:MAG TPA: MgtC/SapB family protein [Acidimicrobiales bacterium]|jgi:putative Mg2+ transporter-C (MgtC) family protein